MKKVKIYHMGRRINGKFDSFKAMVRRAVRFTVRWSLISAAAYAIFMAGALIYSTSTVTASTKTITIEAEAPILERIQDCESGNGTKGSARHFGKDGQVITHVNTNGTIDIGIMQINSIHGKEATSLGLNLYDEKDNIAYGKWLYANRGTGDWYSSAKCWQH